MTRLALLRSGLFGHAMRVMKMLWNGVKKTEQVNCIAIYVPKLSVLHRNVSKAIVWGTTKEGQIIVSFMRVCMLRRCVHSQKKRVYFHFSGPQVKSRDERLAAQPQPPPVNNPLPPIIVNFPKMEPDSNSGMPSFSMHAALFFFLTDEPPAPKKSKRMGNLDTFLARGKDQETFLKDVIKAFVTSNIPLEKTCKSWPNA